VQGISDIITIPGIINRDFADVKTIMQGMGYAVMGTATGKGQHRATEAAQSAIASPLLEAGAIDGARGILINITGSSSLKLAEVNEASTIIQSAAHEDANIIFGAVLDETMKDEVKITVIATGFRADYPQKRERVVAAAASSGSRTTSSYVPPPSNPPLVNSAPFEEVVAEVPAPAMSVAAGVQVLSGVGVMPTPRVNAGVVAAVDSSVPDLDGAYSAADGEDLDIPAFIRKRTQNV